MKKDLRRNIDSITTFLGCKSRTEDEKAQLEQHLSVKNFKSCATLNKANFVGQMENIDSSNPENGVGFVRKGIVDDWVNYFMEEMSARFLEQDNTLAQFNPQDKFPIAHGPLSILLRFITSYLLDTMFNVHHQLH